MLKRYHILFLAFAAVVSTARAETGEAFGVTMGESPSKYSCSPLPSNPGFFRCDTLPQHHPDMEFYLVQSFPTTGICFVKGIGKSIDTDSDGQNIRAKVDDLAGQMSSLYGRGERMDTLSEGSKWAAPQDWMTALIEDDRAYYYLWNTSNGARLNNAISTVFVGAKPESAKRAFPIIEFYFENREECKAKE